ncbi:MULTISPECIES: hypothetical protein [Streptomyces]|uniref:hypothetical protein n=1 Tax=Streptomyces TaxID=1883 RepID=UPI00224899D1|nr:hypothetical protein [Streptomyces sp. JHD 1]MCX2968893.1 hypothetical protein [Streptomyces sp. JHD 1]
MRRGVTRYWTQVVGEGAVRGDWVAVVLGACQTRTPDGALNWLRAQAWRLADRLEPEPGGAWWAPPGALRPRPDSDGDAGVSGRMRAWVLEPGRQRAALGALIACRPLDVVFGDVTARYVLRARPVSLPSRGGPGVSRRGSG